MKPGAKPQANYSLVHHHLQIENFTVSFSDGRALCYLVHHYHPALLALDDINQETTQTQYQRTEESPTKSDADDSFEGPWGNSYSPSKLVHGLVYQL